jgi:hypothetical protein
MILTTKSKHLIKVFENSEYYSGTNKHTDSILSEFYYKLYNAHMSSLSNIKPIVRTVKSPAHIIKSTFFSASSFPSAVIKHIDEFTRSSITYEFFVMKRKITVHFIVEETDVNIHEYDMHIRKIMMWLHVLSKYASDQCSASLVVYIYMTSLEKKLPSDNSTVLDENNVNTAFTTTCPVNSEIVIFRREEWFKVLIHETFHNFGSDFSDMNTNESTRRMLAIFKIESEVKLYESYAEFWAEMINAMFYSFLKLKDKTNKREFLADTEYNINLERTYSMFQLVKTLDYMGLEYKDLYRANTNKLYKEKTSVLSYYIIKAILLNNYQRFLSWCKTNNSNLLQFEKTQRNQKAYCDFIEKNYKTKTMFDGIDEASDIFYSTRNHFLLSNMRMSIIEMK